MFKLHMFVIGFKKENGVKFLSFMDLAVEKAKP